MTWPSRSGVVPSGCPSASHGSISDISKFKSCIAAARRRVAGSSWSIRDDPAKQMPRAEPAIVACVCSRIRSAENEKVRSRPSEQADHCAATSGAGWVSTIVQTTASARPNCGRSRSHLT